MGAVLRDAFASLPARLRLHQLNASFHAGSKAVATCPFDETLTCGTPPAPLQSRLADETCEMAGFMPAAATPELVHPSACWGWRSAHDKPNPQTLSLIKSKPLGTRFLGIGLDSIVLTLHNFGFHSWHARLGMLPWQRLSMRLELCEQA